MKKEAVVSRNNRCEVEVGKETYDPLGPWVHCAGIQFHPWTSKV